MLDRVIKAVSDVNYKQHMDNLWDRALNKWVLVYTCVSFSTDIGTRIWQKIVLEQDVIGARAVIRDVVGNKSPRSINKRAGSMLSLFDWLHGQQKFSWPLVPEHVSEYMGECPKEGKGHTRGKSFMEALRFCKHVMCFDDLQIAEDPQLLGRSKRLDSGKENIKRDIGLETLVHETVSSCAFFYMHSRSRWSDLSMVQFVELDSQEVDGEQFGFFESSTKYQECIEESFGDAISRTSDGLHKCGVVSYLGGDHAFLRH